MYELDCGELSGWAYICDVGAPALWVDDMTELKKQPKVRIVRYS